MTNSFPKIIYYKAKDELPINQLPFFFGWVEFVDEKIKGKHYKPKLEKDSGAYMIGYYNIEGQAADFLQTFDKHTLLEITEEDFKTLLNQWTQDGESTPNSWGLGLVQEIAKSSP